MWLLPPAVSHLQSPCRAAALDRPRACHSCLGDQPMPDLPSLHSTVSYQGLCIDQASEDSLLANSSQGPWTLPLLNLPLPEDEQPKDLKHQTREGEGKGREARERERRRPGF